MEQKKLVKLHHSFKELDPFGGRPRVSKNWCASLKRFEFQKIGVITQQLHDRLKKLETVFLKLTHQNKFFVNY